MAASSEHVGYLYGRCGNPLTPLSTSLTLTLTRTKYTLTMKLLLAAILPTISSAFVSSSINSQHAVVTRNTLTELAVTTGANGRAAASKEEDLALTLQIIMENLSSQDDNGGVVDDDDDDGGKVTESPKAEGK